jgi:hypothetical protein
MENLAVELQCDQVILEYGKVKLAEDRLFMVETASGTVAAGKSFNCLIEPLPGDTVMVSRSDSERCYILSILERDDTACASLIFDGDVAIKAKKGRFSIAAQEGIDLVSAKDTSLVSPALSVNSVQADISMQNVSFFGTLFQGQIEKIKLVGQSCDSIFDRVSQSVKRSYRWVTELDQLRAGQLNYLVKKLMSLRGKYSVITAEEDVRIDGDKILMG